MAQTDQKLHLGCGSITFSGWINIDLDSPTADRLLDLTEPLPFADSSVSHIFNEHFIEHVTREQAVAFLKECFRVLTPDGAIRITTPNLRFLAHSYFSDSKNEWGDLWQPNSRCQMMNEGMRSWGHQFVYDAEELTRVIGEAGFKTIVFQAYRQSDDDVFCGLESRPFHNELIAEARKSSDIDVNVDFSAVSENESTWISETATSVQAQERASVKTELESAARAEFIEVQSARIREVEAALISREADVLELSNDVKAKDAKIAELAAQIQANDTLNLQLIDGKDAEIAELAAQIQANDTLNLQLIDGKNAEIAAISESLATQVQANETLRLHLTDAKVAEVWSISQSLAAQVQMNEMLKSQLNDAKAELKTFQESWCGRIKSFFNRTAK